MLQHRNSILSRVILALSASWSYGIDREKNLRNDIIYVNALLLASKLNIIWINLYERIILYKR